MKASETIDSVTTTCRILDALRRHGEMGVTELSRKLDLEKSTTYRHLTTLREQNFVVKSNDAYKLSLVYFDMAEQVKRQLQVYDEIVDAIDKLAVETGEVAQFALEEQNRVVYIYKSEGENAISVVSGAGYEGSFHCTGLGKAILAQLPEEKVNEIINQQGLTPETENTITEKRALLEELETIQEQGFATDNEEFMSGVVCVAVPVLLENPSVIGAISISAPASRINQNRIENEIVPKATDAANIIEVNSRVER